METEQIVQYNSAKASFVQVSQRGKKKKKVGLIISSGNEIVQIMCNVIGPTDTRLDSVLLVTTSKPQIQAQTADQQERQSREILLIIYIFIFSVAVYFNS